MTGHRLAPLRLSLAVSLAVVALGSTASAQSTPAGLRHQWSFDEGYGAQVAHDSVGGVDGVSGGDVIWVTGEAAALGPARDKVVVTWPQAGADDPAAYIDFGSAVGAFGANDFTVCHYFVTSHNQPGTLSDVIGNRTSYGHGNFFAVRMRGDGTLTVELDQDTYGTGYVGFVANGWHVNDSRLHHLAYVRQGGTLSLYIDGALAGSGRTATGAPTFVSGASSFRIGRRAPFAFTSLAAFYDDLRIYDRALTPAEIQAIAAGG